MKLKIMLLALLCGTLLTGCIKEDLSDCPRENVSIYFQYKAGGETDVLNQYMDRVDLYVFDENCHILGKRTYGHDELAAFSAMPSFELPPGRYTVVAVGNPYDRTEVTNLSTPDLEQIFLQHPDWDGGRPVTGHDDNYLGQLTINVPDGYKAMRDTVELFSAHVDVAVEVFGLPAPGIGSESGMPYELRFENSNAQTSFNNNVNRNETGTCYASLVYDEKRGCYRTDDLALFRMDQDGTLLSELCRHELVLINTETGGEVARVNIYDYLKNNAAEQERVTAQEALLALTLRYSSLGVSVEVPEWIHEDIKPEF